MEKIGNTIDEMEFPRTPEQMPPNSREPANCAGGRKKPVVETCTICDGTGWAPEERNGLRAVRMCECWREQIDLTDLGFGREHAGARLTDFPQEVGSDVRPLLVGGAVGLFVAGNVGAGKTRLLAGICREFRLAGKHVGFTLAKALYRRLWESFRDGATETESAVLRHFAEVDFLAIDDLGREGRITPAVVSALHEILSERISHGRPTAVSTNLDIGQIAEVYDAAIASRLGLFLALPLLGADRRATIEGGNSESL